jgi:SAM-dependent methyltransferase
VDDHAEAYEARFTALAASGRYLHGEADLVDRLLGGPPARILDAGCGTGRVAIELARRGYEVQGVDRDPQMLAVARRKAPDLPFALADLADPSLAKTLARQPFDLVVLAGNVLCFLAPGSLPAVATAVRAALAPGGWFVAGFQLATEDRPRPRPAGLLGPFHPPGRREAETAFEAAGLRIEGRLATWEGEPFDGSADYLVLLGRRPSTDASDPRP